MRSETRGHTAALAIAGMCVFLASCNLPPIVDPVVPPAPTTVVTQAASVGGSLECGGSMTCGPGTALVGERDGTGCGVTSQGMCSAVQTTTKDGSLFSGIHHANCQPLPYFNCGQRAQCPNGKILVGYSDGSGCGIPNGGQCCDLLTDVGNRPLVTSSCYIAAPIQCGESSKCAPGEVMVGRVDGTGCGVLNQIMCCGLTLK